MEVEIKTKGTHEDGRIKTMEDLIRECKVALEKWTITDGGLNKWEVGAKNAKKEIVVEPLFQVRLKLERSIGNMLLPARGLPVGPAVIAGGPGWTEPGVKSALFLPDFQIGYEWNEDFTYLKPFHDRQAIDVALQLAQDMQPNEIIILGDFLDLPPFGKFSAGRYKYVNTTQAAIEEGYCILRDLRERCFKSRITFLIGNHEIRLENFLNKNAPEATRIRPAGEKSSPLKIRNLLRFDELRIEANDSYDKPMWLWDRICIRHGEEYTNLSAKKVSHTTVQGHGHGIVYSVKTVLSPVGPRIVTMMSPGCLCKTDGTVPGLSQNPDWQNGVGIAYLDTHIPNSQEHLSVLPIHAGILWHAGRQYRANTEEALALQAMKVTGIAALQEPQTKT